MRHQPSQLLDHSLSKRSKTSSKLKPYLARVYRQLFVLVFSDKSQVKTYLAVGIRFGKSLFHACNTLTTEPVLTESLFF
jgi:hypothetical protein